MQHITYLEVNDQQLWDDTLMMTVMPLAKTGLVLGRPHHVAEAKHQFLLHIQYLFDTKTGLFFHGWTFHEGGHNFADARWTRGNSWLTIAMPEFIELLGLTDDDPVGAVLRSTLDAQCEALARLQGATAGFAFGMLKARRRRYVRDDLYGNAGVRAVRAVLENVSPERGLLRTSFGIGMGRDLQHYKDIPVTSMPYSQAMAIMALVDILLDLGVFPDTNLVNLHQPAARDPLLLLCKGLVGPRRNFRCLT